MIKNKFIILLFVTLSIICLLFWAVTLFNQKEENRSYYTAALNIQSPWQTKDSIYYFTGTYFAKLNVDDNIVDDIGDDNVNVAVDVDDDTGGIDDDDDDDDDEINVFIAIS